MSVPVEVSGAFPGTVAARDAAMNLACALQTQAAPAGAIPQFITCSCTDSFSLMCFRGTLPRCIPTDSAKAHLV